MDEVGDIPIEIQPKLLRALQEREFERLGSTHTRKVNVRLIAATNRNLEQMVAERQFRSDLYYRLNVFPIRIPPLRERREDIPLLVSYFVERFAKQMQKKIDSIPAAVMKALKTWEWPGNIRELENFIERAVILTRGRSLEAPHAELRKVAIDDSKGTQADHGDIARIVKETINALHGNSSVADERTKKQRDAIVRALTESKGARGWRRWSCRAPGHQSHHLAGADEKARYRSPAVRLTSGSVPDCQNSVDTNHLPRGFQRCIVNQVVTAQIWHMTCAVPSSWTGAHIENLVCRESAPTPTNRGGQACRTLGG
jgi:transcriptional regulator with AAA-type ATPase domain